MADSSPRRTNRASRSSSHSRQGHSDSRMARHGRNSSRARLHHHSSTSNDTTAHDRHQTLTQQWSWMPSSLATWRVEERIEFPSSVGDVSPMDISPYTQEPAHFTVPVLAARVHRHERRLHGMDLELREARELWRRTAMERIAQVSGEQENTVANMNILRDQFLESGNEITQTMEVVRNQLTGNQNEISVLQTRLQEAEAHMFDNGERVDDLEQQLRRTIGMMSRLTTDLDRVVALIPSPMPPPNQPSTSRQN